MHFKRVNQYLEYDFDRGSSFAFMFAYWIIWMKPTLFIHTDEIGIEDIR